MITPEYRISQDEKFLTLNITLKYVKISQCEMLVEPRRYSFFLKPYFLKLEFEQEFVEGDDGLESTIYDSSTYNLEVKIKKKVPGEHFKNLDVISSLLQVKKPKLHVSPKIEVLGSATNEGQQEDADGMEEPDRNILQSPYRFGFNFKHLDMFTNRQEELFELADVDPLATKIEERASVLHLIEDEKFDADHYLCNAFDLSAIGPQLQAPLVLPVKGKNFSVAELQAKHGDATLK